MSTEGGVFTIAKVSRTPGVETPAAIYHQAAGFVTGTRCGKFRPQSHPGSRRRHSNKIAPPRHSQARPALPVRSTASVEFDDGRRWRARTAKE